MPLTTDKSAMAPLPGNGVITSWDFDFYTWNTDEIKLYLVDESSSEEIVSNFSISLNADQDTNPGGTVTYPVSGDAVASGFSLLIMREVTFTQEVDLQPGAFNPDVLETALNKIVAMCQQLKETLTRTAIAPPGYSAEDYLGQCNDHADEAEASADEAKASADEAEASADEAEASADEAEASAASVSGRSVAFVLSLTDTAVAVGNGLHGFPVPANMNGLALSSLLAICTTKGSSGTTTIQIRRVRAGAAVDMLSSSGLLSLGDAYSSTTYTIDTDNDDIQTGDLLIPDTDTVRTGQMGVHVILTFGV